VLFSLPDLDIARSWNVIAGQFLGASSAFACVALLGGRTALVAGCSVALAFVLMRLFRALHPPGASTAMIIALVPADHGVRFLFFPVLAGAVTITVVAWLVHLGERLLMARVAGTGD
jgi:CBS domain-containing membrane protein